MAAGANPSGVHNNGSNNNGNSKTGVQEKANGGGMPGTENSQTVLLHNPGLSRDWTDEEQSTLNDLLTIHASETILVRYAKIAQILKDKTVRDVALRCRWMNRKENGKKRKDNHNSRKNKDKKGRVKDPLTKSSQVARYIAPSIMMDGEDGIPYDAIGGVTGQLLERNAHALYHISDNFSAFKIHENIDLFCQARANILSILNDSNNLPELMKQMPPLPVKLNEELANSILPGSPLVKKS